MNDNDISRGPRLYMTPASRVAKLDGENVDRVTSILNALAKPALVNWAAGAAADYAIDHWDSLADLPTSQKLKLIRSAPDQARNKAATRGTQIHEYGEKISTGEPVDVPEELLGPVSAYAKFLDVWRITPIATETPVANTVYRYAGRADLWATIGARDNARALIDLKAGKDVYPETALQLAAYRYCDLWQPDGPESETTLPPVDCVYVAHILPDTVEMVPAKADEAAFRQFLYTQQTAQWMGRHNTKRKRDGGEWTVDEPLIGAGERP